jgi:hypothetical protein
VFDYLVILLIYGLKLVEVGWGRWGFDLVLILFNTFII